MVAMNVWPTDAASGSVATEARWRKMGRVWAPSGVVAGLGAEMAPSLAYPNLTIGDGAAWVDGHYAELVSSQVLTATANGLAVVRFDPAANSAELLWRDGATVPTQSLTGIWELPIYKTVGSVGTDMRAVPGGWRTYSPTWLPGSGLGTGGTVTGRYFFVSPTLLHLRVALTLGTSPTLPAGQIAVGLPPGFTAGPIGANQFGTGLLNWVGRGFLPLITYSPSGDATRLFFLVQRAATPGASDISASALVETMTHVNPNGWAVAGSWINASIVLEARPI
jgi:hypothetical protein